MKSKNIMQVPSNMIQYRQVKYRAIDFNPDISACESYVVAILNVQCYKNVDNLLIWIDLIECDQILDKGPVIIGRLLWKSLDMTYDSPRAIEGEVIPEVANFKQECLATPEGLEGAK